MVAWVVLSGRERQAWSDVAVFANFADQVRDGGPAWLGEYPPAARLLVMLPAVSSSPVFYAGLFIGLVAAADAAVLLRLSKQAAAHERRLGVVLWIVGPAVLGSLSWLRFDLIVAGIAVFALSAASPVAARLLGFLAIQLKIWPVLLLPLLVRQSRRPFRAGLIALGASAAIFSALAWVPGGTAFSWASWALDRGVNLESTSGLVLAGSSLFGGDVHVSFGFGSWQIDTPGAAGAVLSTGFGVVGLVAIATLSIDATRSRSRSRGLLAACVCIEILLLTSKVFSPQYVLWLLGPAAVLLSSVELRRPRYLLVLTLAVCAATHLVYPLTYASLLGLEPFAITVLLVRTLLLVALLLATLREWMTTRDTEIHGLRTERPRPDREPGPHAASELAGVRPEGLGHG